MWSKMSQNSPFTTTEKFWGYFLAQPYPDFFQKQRHAHGISFPQCGRKKNSPNLGYGLARPRIFRDLCQKLSLIHTPIYSTPHFWIGKTSPKLLKLYFFVYLYKMDPKGKNEPGPGDLWDSQNKGIGKELLQVFLMNQFQQFLPIQFSDPKDTSGFQKSK